VVVNGGNCQWPGINWVHMVHHAGSCVDHGAPLSFRLRNRLSRWLACRAEKRALRCSSLVFVNSERTRRDVTAALGVSPDRVQLVYLGVDEQQHATMTPAERLAARARWKLSAADVAVLFVGALGFDRRKGFDTLLAASSRLRTLVPNLKILAAGGGAIRYWQAKVEAAGLSACVRLLGHIDDVPALLGAADLLVSPSRYEPYGLGVHEALCRDVPAIVSRAAGVAERYPPQLAMLLLDDPEDDAELAGRIAGCLRERELMRPMVQHFASSLRGYSWRQMAEHILELVEAYYRPCS
jgi:glycosyltransferase involved in cell wall biosynthesis